MRGNDDWERFTFLVNETPGGMDDSKQPAVYIMTSGERGILYTGVTGNLKLRVWELEGFT